MNWTSKLLGLGLLLDIVGVVILLLGMPPPADGTKVRIGLVFLLAGFGVQFVGNWLR